MMPMPPTTSEIDATVASSSAMIRLLPSHDVRDLTQISDREIVDLAGLDVVPTRQRVGHLRRSPSAPASDLVACTKIEFT